MPHRLLARALLLPSLLALPACDLADSEPEGASHDANTESATESREPEGLVGITDAHNEVRAGAEPAPTEPLRPLAWDPAIASEAQAYADACRYGHSQGELGENLFATAGRAATVEDVVSAWGDEDVDFDLEANRCAPGKKCGHYTQIVWRDTTRLGCGVATCTENSPFPGFTEWQYWVCNYDPPGNWQGERPY